MAIRSQMLPAWSGYSDRDWESICAAAKAAGLEPLTLADRTKLNGIGGVFRDNRLSPRATARQVDLWLKVARACKKLRAAISEAERGPGTTPPTFYANWTGRFEHGADTHGENLTLDDLLEWCETDAKWLADYIHTNLKREDVRGLQRQFFSEVLRVWLEHGGGPSFSTDRGRASGNLVRFMRAATHPVIPNKPPPDETIKTFLAKARKAKTTAKTLGPTFLGDLWRDIALMRNSVR